MTGLPQPLRLETVVAGDEACHRHVQRDVADDARGIARQGRAEEPFKTDVGDPTSTSGGVPGGNAVTARWALEPGEALLVRVMPPTPCAYWDVQVGNGWYESFDYRHRFCGLTCDGVTLEPTAPWYSSCLTPTRVWPTGSRPPVIARATSPSAGSSATATCRSPTRPSSRSTTLPPSPAYRPSRQPNGNGSPALLIRSFDARFAR